MYSLGGSHWTPFVEDVMPSPYARNHIEGCIQSKFGPTSSPKVNLFDILRSKYSKLDLTAFVFSKCDPVVDIYKSKVIQNLQYLNSGESNYLPRDDFEKLLKLSLLYLTSKVLMNSLFNG